MAAQVPSLLEMLPHFESTHSRFNKDAFLDAYAHGEAVTHIVDGTLLGVAYCDVLRARKKVKGWRILTVIIDNSLSQATIDTMLEELLSRVSAFSLYVPDRYAEMVGERAVTVRLMRNVPKPARAPILHEMGMSVPNARKDGLAMMDLMVKVIPPQLPLVALPELAPFDCAAVPRDVHHKLSDCIVQPGAK